MAVDAYIYFADPGAGFPTPKGETQDAYFITKGAFEIKEFSFDIENQTTLGSGSGGGGAGRTKFNAFTIKKATDQASPLFLQNCVGGAHYGKVTLAIRKSGSDPASAGAPFLTYEFGTVFTTKITWSGPSEDAPDEGIEFVYGTLIINYTPQAKTGDMLPVVTAGWNQIKNVKHP